MAVPRKIITSEMIVEAYRLDQFTDTPKRTIAAGLGVSEFTFYRLKARWGWPRLIDRIPRECPPLDDVRAPSAVASPDARSASGDVENDDIPRDMDELRRALSRRMEEISRARRKGSRAKLKPDELAVFDTDFKLFAHRISFRRDLAPNGEPWTTWLLLGGRGAGKTRAGAEWVRALALGSSIGHAGASRSSARPSTTCAR